MARHGQCHCGMVLKFRLRPWGYKKRCPRCGAIVRLRSPSSPSPHPNLRTLPGPQLLDVELVQLGGVGTPRPVIYWAWVAAAAGLALAALLVLIWFTRR